MFGKTRLPVYAPSADQLVRRQYVEENGRYVWFWYTRTGVIVKWSLFLGITILLALYLILGRMHAKKRVNRGMKPMAYHGWLLSRQERAGVDPRYAWPQSSYTNYPAPGYGPPPGGAYGMHAMPPPVYDPNNRPPMYEGGPPPFGGTKVDPMQTGVTAPTGGDYAPPPGPPPAAQR
ncbi:uncharacterized protein GGS22DRAFT_58125 [Annulohypoxylon maeteangense]|uniref:uncharacterized protein n=1 Tax=Annulohypoxylon maeteangense TaxID=1927788 RepID=UPI0020074485|nr:uncharacterized protein GGS22DRAFT_58125 [Annulohypoxylon maeteangense]KAI0881441.1 hypothetical protein GGS22DRAFT_58125 [Annulohypoxylon maeteangense]